MANNRIYIVLTLVLIILSLSGLYFFYQPSPSALISNLPTPTPVDVTEPTPTQLPTLLPSITPTPAFNLLSNDQYGFSVPYGSHRQLYTAAEFGGSRFTLFAPVGSITVHAGPGWSWQHPSRQFSADTLVSGQSTFIYQTDSQTIIDFQKNNHSYTIQCVHNGQELLKTECQQFMSEFKLTN